MIEILKEETLEEKEKRKLTEKKQTVSEKQGRKKEQKKEYKKSDRERSLHGLAQDAHHQSDDHQRQGYPG